MEQSEIRQFTPADRDWLVAAHGQNYAASEGFDASFGVLVEQIIDGFVADHDPSCERGWVAWDGDRRLGCIFCVRLSPQMAKLRLFLLEPAARGRGLGRRLLDICTGFARDCGYADMQLWTHESHTAACALYLRNGWYVVSSQQVHAFGQDLIELEMARSLRD